jgi:hypothetical protein
MTWACLACTFASNTTDVCSMCTTPKPRRPLDMPIARDLFLCSQCSVPNAVSADACVACDHDFNGPPSFLSCRVCTCLNSARALACVACEAPLPAAVSEDQAIVIGNDEDGDGAYGPCRTCSFDFPLSEPRCDVCGAPRDPLAAHDTESAEWSRMLVGSTVAAHAAVGRAPPIPSRFHIESDASPSIMDIPNLVRLIELDTH